MLDIVQNTVSVYLGELQREWSQLLPYSWGPVYHDSYPKLERVISQEPHSLTLGDPYQFIVDLALEDGDKKD